MSRWKRENALRQASLTGDGFDPEKSPDDISIMAEAPDGVTYSLFESAHILKRAPDRPWVEGTSTRAATHHETVAGKLMGRTSKPLARESLGMPGIPTRDVYDIAVMAHLNPKALKRSLAHFSVSERRMAYNVYPYLPDNLHEIDPSPIVDGKFLLDDLPAVTKGVGLAIRDADPWLIPSPSSVPPAPKGRVGTAPGCRE